MWFERERWRHRLLAESTLMKVRYPQLRLHRTDKGLVWLGTVEPLSGSFFQLEVEYPSAYPYEEPHLYVLHPKLKSDTPHLYSGNRLCVHRTAWNPDRGTAASVVGLACEWLFYYLHWRETGESW